MTFHVSWSMTWQLHQPISSGIGRSHRLLYIQVPQVVPNLVFPYSERGFAPLVPIMQSINWGGVRREVASDQGLSSVSHFQLMNRYAGAEREHSQADAHAHFINVMLSL